MAGINGFNGYYNCYTPQYSFKSANDAANNAFSQVDVYSTDGKTLDQIIVIKNGQKTHKIGFRDKGKTGDLRQFNKEGEREFSIAFAINGEKGKRFIRWSNSDQKI